jgi:hypothetical protein
MQRPIVLIVAGLLAGVLAACGGGGSDDEDAGSSTTSTVPSTATTEAAGEADVDLRFTGTYVLQIKDTYGACTGAGTFAFSMTGEDVDGIGDEFKVEQATSGGGGKLTWEIDSTNSYEGGTGTTFTADGKTAKVDEELQRVGAPSGAPARPEHVAGTITCP